MSFDTHELTPTQDAAVCEYLVSQKHRLNSPAFQMAMAARDVPAALLVIIGLIHTSEERMGRLDLPVMFSLELDRVIAPVILRHVSTIVQTTS